MADDNTTSLRRKLVAILPRWLLYGYRWVYFSSWNLRYTIPAFFRRCGMGGRQYEKLRSLKNKYAGKHCFIVATGPSLTVEDLELLKGEYTFGDNAICLLGDRTDWKPNFFCVSDSQVVDKLHDSIWAATYEHMFFPDIYCQRYSYKPEWIPYPCNFTDSLYEQSLNRTSYALKFSDDAYSQVYDGGTVVYSVLQLAVYLGFREIYLLGVDCNYSVGKQHFVSGGVDVPTEKIEYTHLNMLNSYRAAKIFADKNGIQIFNATRGGMLEVFPRRSLEEALECHSL